MLIGVDQVVQDEAGNQEIVAFQQGDDESCVTPATSVPTSGPVTTLPGTGDGSPDSDAPASIFLLLGGATLLAAGVLLARGRPTGDT